MREVNVGYQGEPGVVPFGVDQAAPDDGFRICRDCGVAIPPGVQPDKVNHRRSCPARRRFEKLKQEGKSGSPFKLGVSLSLSLFAFRSHPAAASVGRRQ